jgi:O-methyltransferase domain
MTNSVEDPIGHVVGQAMGYMYSGALRAATLLGVAEHLADGPRDPAELAGLTGSNGPFLRRTLRFLATRGIFREDGEGRFHLTPHADLLRADAPNSIKKGVLTLTSETYWQSTGDFVEAVRHGEPAFDRRYGQPFFAYLGANPETAVMFAEGMASMSAGETAHIVAAYDFPESGVVVDVGGGQGGLLLDVLRARPDLHGLLLDQEPVLAGNVLGQLGADHRWKLEPGDFFESVPAGDLYLVKNVLHDWNDEQCVRILSNCRAAMNPGARVVAVDAVVPPGNEAHFGKAIDIMMLLLASGQERTRPEFERLFERAGLRITRVIPFEGAFAQSVIEAEAA